MFSWCKAAESNKAVTVGWTITPQPGGLIWYNPEPIERDNVKTPSPKAVTKCPAVLDLESRYYVIRAPFDMNFKLKWTKKGVDFEFYKPQESPVSLDNFRRGVIVSPQEQWRHPKRPIIQIVTPYRFVTDDNVYISQLPAFLHYHPNFFPGVLFSGRFPLNVWPRALMWAFEWHDMEQPIIFKRGEPWFMAYFETDNPDKKIRMVEAKRTDEFIQYCDLIDSVTPMVNKTFSLFKNGWKRRPKKLLVPKDM